MTDRKMIQLLFLLLFISASSAYAAEGGNVSAVELSAVSAVIYNFQDQLSKAEALILEQGKIKKAGTWQQDRFIFPAYEEYTQIGMATNKYNDVDEKGIFFHPVQDGIRRLRFRGVPPGSTMTLYYGIDDTGASAEEDFSVYLRVWVGTHELRRVRVPKEKGWKKEEINLGPASFLKHDVIVTFEVTSDNIQDSRFSFYAEIHQ